MIDYKSQISTHFTWHDALWLPKWQRYALPQDGLNDDILVSLKLLFLKLSDVRDFFNLPMKVHCAYRPEIYNQEVGGAHNSAHMMGKACDFDVEGMSCDDARTKLLDYDMLNHMNMRMENNPGSSWVHLDTKPLPAGGTRYFKP